MEFHFLRPWFLLLLPLLPVLAFYVIQRHSNKGSWEQLIDPHLFSYLSSAPAAPANKWIPYFLGLSWILATLALAGPTWKKIPQPVFEKQIAQIVVLDLSYSMWATDLPPNRLERALFKTRDLLERIQEGSTALIAYAGDAHVIVPLTQDTETIASMLSALNPEIMPVAGSRPDKAIALAVELFQNNLINTGSIFWITDGVKEPHARAIEKILNPHNFQLSVLAAGTLKGAPISLPKGGLLKDPDGGIVIPRLELNPLRQLSHTFNGIATVINVQNTDIDQILSAQKDWSTENEFVKNKDEKVSDQWEEEGHWLVLILLPLVALGFRKGVFLNVALLYFGLSLFSALLLPSSVFALQSVSIDRQV